MKIVKEVIDKGGQPKAGGDGGSGNRGGRHHLAGGYCGRGVG